MVIEPARIALQDWLGHICGPADAALFAPQCEAAQMLLASGDSLLGVVLHAHPFQMRRTQARHPTRVGHIAHREPGLSLSPPAHQRAPCACLRFAATYDGAISSDPISAVSGEELRISLFGPLA